MKVLGIYIVIAIAAITFFGNMLLESDFNLKLYKECEAISGVPAKANAFDNGGYEYIYTK